MRQAWFRWVDRELDRCVDLPDRETMDRGAWNRLIGETGERLARKQILREGGKVLYRNFRPPKGGEVDVVFREEEILAFAEVKTRTSKDFGRPADAVNLEKERLIIRGANAWIRELNLPEVLFRFDVIEVLLFDGEKAEVRIHRDAFTTPQRGLGM